MIQLYVQVVDGNNSTIHDERDCPLLRKTKIILTVPTTNIISIVSIIHNCSSTCKYYSQPHTLLFEREEVSSSKLPLRYRHDYSNASYLLNTYFVNSLHLHCSV